MLVREPATVPGMGPGQGATLGSRVGNRGRLAGFALPSMPGRTNDPFDSQALQFPVHAHGVQSAPTIEVSEGQNGAVPYFG